jgi:hypothetical protein
MPHPLSMLVWAEDVDTALLSPEGLQALEDGLPVVKGAQGRQYLDLAEGYDLWLLPCPVGIIHLEHMIGELFSEAQMVEVDLAYPALLHLSGLYFHFFACVPRLNTEPIF